MDRKHNENLTPFARALRKNMTKEEKHLWYDYLRKCSKRFTRQKIMGKYIVDFYCAELNLIIEIDGSQHFYDKNIIEDAIRTEYLKQYNAKVIRIPNNEINYNFDGVCEYLDSILK